MQEDACQNYAMPGIMWAGGVERMQGLDAMVLSPRPTYDSIAMMSKKGLKFAQIIFSNAIQCIFSLFRPPSSVCQSSSLTPSPRLAC